MRVLGCFFVLDLARVILIAGLGAGAAFAQAGDRFNTPNSEVERLFEAGKYAEAVTLQRTVARDVEEAEIASAGQPGPQTAEALGGLAYYALYERRFDEALAASERAHSLAPDLLV